MSMPATGSARSLPNAWGWTCATWSSIHATSIRNIYVVDAYWALGFLNLETRLLRIVEVNRKPVATIEGPTCLGRDDAGVAARPLEGDADGIAVSFVGAPVAVQ